MPFVYRLNITNKKKKTVSHQDRGKLYLELLQEPETCHWNEISIIHAVIVFKHNENTLYDINEGLDLHLKFTE